MNAAPVATITSHGPTATVTAGVAVLFEGEVSDPDDELGDLRVSWSLDGETVCAAAPPDEEGLTTCLITPAVGASEVVLQVEDPSGAVGQDEVLLTVLETGVPGALIVQPTAEGRYYALHPVTFEGVASHTAEAPGDLAVSWTSDLQGALTLSGADAEGLTGGDQVLMEGTHLVTLQVTDSHEQDAVDTVEVVVGPPNSAPSCAIVSPADGATAGPGATVTLAGEVSDPDQPAPELEVSWSSSLDGHLADVEADAAGAVGFTTDLLSLGAHVLTLQVTDELGATCSDSISFLVGFPPIVDIQQPLSGDVVALGDEVVFTGEVFSLEWTSDNLAVTWTSDVDGELLSGMADASGYTGFLTSALSAGDHEITLVAEEPSGFWGSDSISLRVNQAPTAPVVDINPASPLTGDDLALVIVEDAVDPDGDPITYTIQWLRDGTAVGTGAVVDASATARGQTWRVEVYASDGWASGPTAWAERTIGNTAPVMTSVALSPQPAVTTDGLSCEATATDADGDGVSFSWAWDVDGTPVGSDAPTLASTNFSKGQTVTCTATPDDGTDTGAPMSDATTIENSPPTDPSISIVPANPVESLNALFCRIDVPSTDADEDVLTYTFEWWVDGVLYTGPTQETDRPGDTIPRSVPAGEETWTCRVTVSDGDGGTASATSTSVTIEPSEWINVLVIGDYTEDNLWVKTNFELSMAEVLIDTMDVSSSVPDLAYLFEFDVVLLYQTWSFDNSQAVGDRLHDYVMSGGKLVIGTFYWQGSWGTLEDIHPLWGGSSVYSTGSLGEVLDHPLNDDLNSLRATYRGGPHTLAANAAAVAWWNDGHVLTAWNEPGSGRITAVTTFPAHPAWQPVEGDFFRLWENALRWTARP